MNLERELFEAIRQNPDDLTPRLIYADWCDQQGDPRGEFIRIQCELAAFEGPPIKVRHLKQREAELWERHRRRWNGEIHRRLAATPLRNHLDSRRGWIRQWEYHRGFVENVVAEAWVFLEYPDALFQIGPLRRVRLVRVQNLLTQVLHSPDLPRLKTMELSMPNDPKDQVERWIKLIRPERASHVAIHPEGCLPVLAPPENDGLIWQRFSSVRPSSSEMSESRHSPISEPTRGAGEDDNPGWIEKLIASVIVCLIMISPVLCLAVLLAIGYLIASVLTFVEPIQR